MADLNDKDAALTVKIVGADPSTGIESNYVDTTANGIKVDGSAVTQPISASSLPLPTGAATSANQTTANTSLASIDSKTPVLGQTTMTGSTPVVIASNQTAIPISGTVTATGTIAVSTGDSIPAPSGYNPIAEAYTETKLSTDYYGNLNIRGQVLTDEGSFRDDFTGSSLTSTLTGTLNWTSGSQTVTGSGTLFTQELTTDSYIKKTTDADTLFVQVLQILSDTELLLADPYGGTTASSAATLSSWVRVLGGGTTSVTNSNVSITSSNNANGKTYLQRAGDYGPMSLITYCSISQRIASQFSAVGFRDAWNNPNYRAEFYFDGTSNTQVKCVTTSSSASADTQTTTVTLPNSLTTATLQRYTVDVGFEYIAFSINDEIVAIHATHLPPSYTSMDIFMGVDNNGAISPTTLTTDYSQYKNFDAVQVYSESPVVPVNTKLVGKSPSGATKLIGASDDYALLTTNVNTKKTSYSAAVLALSAANTATDIFTLTGSATKTIRITKVEVSATQTTAGAANIVMLKRSTANSGGTSTTPTIVALDSTNGAGTAVVRAYTANPTVGTLVGNLRAHKLFIPTTTGSPVILSQKFGDNNQELVLRGTSEVFAINLNSTTLGGNSFNIFIEWTEE